MESVEPASERMTGNSGIGMKEGMEEVRPAEAGDERAAARTRQFELAAWLVILFGTLVRVRQYLGGRSLAYDEARVSLEIAERSLAQMFDMEGFIRVAPPGWFLLEKLSMLSLGTGELSLRLVPFVAGLIALPLMWIVPRRYLGPGAGLACVALGAVSPHIIIYSSEVKQYSTDVLWCLLVLLAMQPILSGQASRRSWIVAGVIGTFGIFFSHPVLFVLGAAGVMLLLSLPRARREDGLSAILLCGVWAVSFAVNYLFFLRKQTGRQTLIDFWYVGFPPLDGFPGAQLRWLFGRGFAYVGMPAGMDSFGLVVFAAIIGFAALLMRQRKLAGMLALTAGLTLAAAAFRVYPVEHRLMLFSVPLLLIAVGAGIDWLSKPASRNLRPGLILFVLLLAHPLLRAVRMVVHPEGREEIKAAVNYAVDRMQEGDGLYLNQTAQGAYEWYATQTTALRNPPERTVLGSHVSVGPDSLRAEMERLRRFRRVWMVFVDFWPDDLSEVITQMEAIAERRSEFSAPGAQVYLYEFR